MLWAFLCLTHLIQYTCAKLHANSNLYRLPFGHECQNLPSENECHHFAGMFQTNLTHSTIYEPFDLHVDHTKLCFENNFADKLIHYYLDETRLGETTAMNCFNWYTQNTGICRYYNGSNSGINNYSTYASCMEDGLADNMVNKDGWVTTLPYLNTEGKTIHLFIHTGTEDGIQFTRCYPCSGVDSEGTHPSFTAENIVAYEIKIIKKDCIYKPSTKEFHWGDIAKFNQSEVQVVCKHTKKASSIYQAGQKTNSPCTEDHCEVGKDLHKIRIELGDLQNDNIHNFQFQLKPSVNMKTFLEDFQNPATTTNDKFFKKEAAYDKALYTFVYDTVSNGLEYRPNEIHYSMEEAKDACNKDSASCLGVTHRQIDGVDFYFRHTGVASTDLDNHQQNYEENIYYQLQNKPFFIRFGASQYGLQDLEKLCNSFPSCFAYGNYVTNNDDNWDNEGSVLGNYFAVFVKEFDVHRLYPKVYGGVSNIQFQTETLTEEQYQAYYYSNFSYDQCLDYALARNKTFEDTMLCDGKYCEFSLEMITYDNSYSDLNILSYQECLFAYEYYKNGGFTYNFGGSVNASVDVPRGCYVDASTVYHNPSEHSTYTCSNTYRCLQKLIARPICNKEYEIVFVKDGIIPTEEETLSEKECSDFFYRTVHGTPYAHSFNAYSAIISDTKPEGCILSGRYFEYNSIMSTIACSPDFPCLLKREKKNQVDYQVVAVSHGYNDNSLTIDECRKYALEVKAPNFILYNYADYPAGCWMSTAQEVRYNVGFNTRVECETVHCLQKRLRNYKKIDVSYSVQIRTSGGIPDMSMTETECQKFGESLGLWRGAGNWASDGAGCFFQGGGVYYKYVWSDRHCDNGGFVCIEKKYDGLILQAFTSGLPDVHVNVHNCKEYASQIGITWHSDDYNVLEEVHGCFFHGSKIYYNHGGTYDGLCDNTFRCIKSERLKETIGVNHVYRNPVIQNYSRPEDGKVEVVQAVSDTYSFKQFETHYLRQGKHLVTQDQLVRNKEEIITQWRASSNTHWDIWFPSYNNYGGPDWTQQSLPEVGGYYDFGRSHVENHWWPTWDANGNAYDHRAYGVLSLGFTFHNDHMNIDVNPKFRSTVGLNFLSVSKDQCKLYGFAGEESYTYKATNGMPDMSMSEKDCRAYASGLPSKSTYEWSQGSHEADQTITQAECHAFAQIYGFAFYSDTYETTSYPHGCWLWTADNNIYYNNKFTNLKCNQHTSLRCLMRTNVSRFVEPAGLTGWGYTTIGEYDASITSTDCQWFAGTVGLSFVAVNDAARIPGCFTDDNTIYYNSDDPATNFHRCDYRLGATCVIRTSGGPLGCYEENKYLGRVFYNYHNPYSHQCSEENRCIQAHRWGGEVSLSNRPYGCFTETSEIQLFMEGEQDDSVSLTACENYAWKNSYSFLKETLPSSDVAYAPTGCFFESQTSKVFFNEGTSGSSCEGDHDYVIVNTPELDRTYTTTYIDSQPGIEYARSMLDSPQAWSASAAQTGDYVIMDLLADFEVVGVVTQNRHDDIYQRVTRMEVEYRDANSSTYTNLGEFEATVDFTKKFTTFSIPVTARFVKIIIKEYLHWPSLRCAVLVKRENCSNGQNMHPSCSQCGGAQPNCNERPSYMLVNTLETDRTYSTLYASPSMLDSAQAYSASVAETGDYVVMDLLDNVIVAGVVTQGRHNDNQWPTRVEIQYRTADTTTYTSAGDFSANVDSRTKVILKLDNPVTARYVKIIMKQYNNDPSMRPSMRCAVIVEREACENGEFLHPSCSQCGGPQTQCYVQECLKSPQTITKFNTNTNTTCPCSDTIQCNSEPYKEYDIASTMHEVYYPETETTDCEAYAVKNGFRFRHVDDRTRPEGCYVYPQNHIHNVQLRESGLVDNYRILTLNECEAYAKTFSPSKWGHASSWFNTYQRGCWYQYSDQTFYYNFVSGVKNGKSFCQSATPCVVWDDNLAIIENNLHTVPMFQVQFSGKVDDDKLSHSTCVRYATSVSATYISISVHIASSGNNFYSLNEHECAAYAINHVDGNLWASTHVFSSTTLPSGCFQNAGSEPNTYIYYNTNVNNVACSANRNCVQIKPSAPEAGKTYSGLPLGCIVEHSNGNINTDTVYFNSFFYGFTWNAEECAHSEYACVVENMVRDVNATVAENFCEIDIVTIGMPQLTLNKSQCEAYALENSMTFSESSEVANPKGCYEQYGTNVYYNTEMNSEAECGIYDVSFCVEEFCGCAVSTKAESVPRLNIDRTECENYANENGVAFTEFADAGNPTGCFTQYGTSVYYNTDTASSAKCGAHGVSLCVEKICRVLPLNNIERGITRHMGNDNSVDKVECLKYAQKHGIDIDNSLIQNKALKNVPKGCYMFNKSVHWNSQLEATKHCSDEYKCIQKQKINGHTLPYNTVSQEECLGETLVDTVKIQFEQKLSQYGYGQDEMVVHSMDLPYGCQMLIDEGNNENTRVIFNNHSNDVDNALSQGLVFDELYRSTFSLRICKDPNGTIVLLDNPYDRCLNNLILSCDAVCSSIQTCKNSKIDTEGCKLENYCNRTEGCVINKTSDVVSYFTKGVLPCSDENNCVRETQLEFSSLYDTYQACESYENDCEGFMHYREKSNNVTFSDKELVEIKLNPDLHVQDGDDFALFVNDKSVTNALRSRFEVSEDRCKLDENVAIVTNAYQNSLSSRYRFSLQAFGTPEFDPLEMTEEDCKNFAVSRRATFYPTVNGGLAQGCVYNRQFSVQFNRNTASVACGTAGYECVKLEQRPDEQCTALYEVPFEECDTTYEVVLSGLLHTFTTTEADCIAYATLMKGTYQQSGSWPGNPQGCMVHVPNGNMNNINYGLVYYNTHVGTPCGSGGSPGDEYACVVKSNKLRETVEPLFQGLTGYEPGTAAFHIDDQFAMGAGCVFYHDPNAPSYSRLMYNKALFTHIQPFFHFIKFGNNGNTAPFDECKYYASINRYSFLEETYASSPMGCYFFRTTSVVYWNHAETATACSNVNRCIQRTVPIGDHYYYYRTEGSNDQSVSMQECKQFAADNNIVWRSDDYSHSSEPPGCWYGVPWSKIYFNHASTSSAACSDSYQCIQKGRQTAPSIWPNEFDSEYTRPYFNEVTSGPNDMSASYHECQQYANQFNYRFFGEGYVQTANPIGCFRYSTTIYFNKATTSTQDCDSTHLCIQKSLNAQNIWAGSKAFQTCKDANGNYYFLTTPSARCSDGYCMQPYKTDVTKKLVSTTQQCVIGDGSSYLLMYTGDTNTIFEIQTGLNTLSLDFDRCKQYATDNSYTWGGDSFSSYVGPKGCFRYLNEVFFNHGSSTAVCDTVHLCIQEHKNEGTMEEKTQRCFEACRDQKPAVGNTKWNGYQKAKNFLTVNDNGRCWCALDWWSHCTKEATGTGNRFYTMDRKSTIETVNDDTIPSGCQIRSKHIVYNTNTSNEDSDTSVRVCQTFNKTIVPMSNAYQQCAEAASIDEYYMVRNSGLCDYPSDIVPADKCIEAANSFGYNFATLEYSNTAEMHTGCFLEGDTLKYLDNMYQGENYQILPVYNALRTYFCRSTANTTQFSRRDAARIEKNHFPMIKPEFLHEEITTLPLPSYHENFVEKELFVLALGFRLLSFQEIQANQHLLEMHGLDRWTACYLNGLKDYCQIGNSIHNYGISHRQQFNGYPGWGDDSTERLVAHFEVINSGSLDQVATEAECREYATFVGGTFRSVSSWTIHPGGCMVYYPSSGVNVDYIYYNTNIQVPCGSGSYACVVKQMIDDPAYAFNSRVAVAIPESKILDEANVVTDISRTVPSSLYDKTIYTLTGNLTCRELCDQHGYVFSQSYTHDMTKETCLCTKKLKYTGKNVLESCIDRYRKDNLDYDEVYSYTNDMTVNSSECAIYADSKSLFFELINNGSKPYGCSRTDNFVYYNSNISGLTCLHDACVQKNHKYTRGLVGFSDELVDEKDCMEYADAIGFNLTNTTFQVINDTLPSGCVVLNPLSIVFNLKETNVRCTSFTSCVKHKEGKTGCQFVTGSDGDAVCPLGHTSFVFSTGCHKCPRGKYGDEVGKPCKQCPNVTSDSAPGSISVANCTCPSGFKFENDACVECTSGKFSNPLLPSHSKTECTDCPLGRAQNMAGKGSCHACLADTYQDERGQIACKGCPTGKFQFSEGGESCDPCEVGTFLKPFVGCTACNNGQYQDEVGKGECKNCPVGFATKLLGQTECQQCPIGRFVDKTGFAECILCYAGYFEDRLQSTACQPCGNAKYQDQAGTTACKNCPNGRYSDTTALTICKNCQSGRYQDQSGTTVCKYCGGGKYQNQVGQSGCKNCGGGQYQNQNGQTSCKNCGTGKYNQYSGQISCTACGVGYYQDQVGTTACKDCGGGKYQDQNGQTSCKNCGVKTYQDQTRQTGCKNCPAGRYTGTDTGLSSCHACGTGTYQDQEGQQYCKHCNTAKYQDQTGQSSCKTACHCCVPYGQSCWDPAEYAICTNQDFWNIAHKTTIYHNSGLFRHTSGGCVGSTISTGYLNNHAQVSNYMDGFRRCRGVSGCKAFQLVDKTIYYYKGCCDGGCRWGGYYTFTMQCQNNVKFHWRYGNNHNTLYFKP